MTFHVLTIFPGIFDSFLKETIVKRALDDRKLAVNLVDIRDFATDKHKTTDDTPYGGGPGMVMKVEPIYHALASLGRVQSSKSKVQSSRVVFLSPRGRQFEQKIAEEYATLESLTLICGRYEGVDQRVADHLCDEELSIGPYVLSGGEVAAMIVIEAVSRLLPGVLGNPESLKEESFSPQSSKLPPMPRLRRAGKARSSLEYPQYTKPEDYMGWNVPKVLLSGNHKEIEQWRKKHMKQP